jgi:hypothetical protein
MKNNQTKKLKLLLMHLSKSMLTIFLAVFTLASCKDQAEELVAKDDTKKSSAKVVASYWDTNSPAIPWARGINNQPSYIGKNRTNYDEIAQLGYNIIRIEYDPSKYYDYSSDMAWQDVVKVVSSTNMNVILTWHNRDYFNGDKTNWNGPIDAYEQFWKYIIPRINALPSSQSGRIIINILNEWGPSDNQAYNWGTWNQNAITKMRAIGYGGRIIVDAGLYGNRLTVFYNGHQYITDNGVIFGVHTYQDGIDQATIDRLDNIRLPNGRRRHFILGEFGVKYFKYTPGKPQLTPQQKEQDKNKVRGLASYARSKGWGVLGWCWEGDGEGMNMKTDLEYRSYINDCLWR